MERYCVTIDVAARAITISVPGEKPLIFSYTDAERGCMGSLISEALQLDSQEAVLPDIPVASEFEDVFQDVPGLPPQREIEFAIEIEKDTMPITRATYRMAPAELKELKVQLENLMQKRFIRVSRSPW